jgi:hypothetical protein
MRALRSYVLEGQEEFNIILAFRSTFAERRPDFVHNYYVFVKEGANYDIVTLRTMNSHEQQEAEKLLDLLKNNGDDGHQAAIDIDCENDLMELDEQNAKPVMDKYGSDKVVKWLRNNGNPWLL